MSAAAIAAALPRRRAAALPWRLHWLPVCASTETQLARRLVAGARPPLAVIAARQTHGHGQRGRVWVSPPGGVWLSAALPWPSPVEPAVAPMASLPLAVSLGLCLELERLGLTPRIKWPNDLLLNGRKLAGVLPRLRWRGGRPQSCTVGVGLNGLNRPPGGAIALAQALAGSRRQPVPFHPQARVDRLAALVLRGLEWAVSAADQGELVRRQAERRLWRAPHWHGGQAWEVAGLGVDGSLRLRRADRLVELRRHF